jgi:uncharacterized protein
MIANNNRIACRTCTTNLPAFAYSWESARFVATTNLLTCLSPSTSTRQEQVFRACLPAGCRLCRLGYKLPVYITLLCSKHCGYCPIPPKMRLQDSILVGHREVKDVHDVAALCEQGRFAGVSISGGEPLLRFERTVSLIRVLRERFPLGFHIHLYTSGELLTRHIIKELALAGLDEIRMSAPETSTVNVSLSSRISLTLETVALRFRIGQIHESIRAAYSAGSRQVIFTEVEINDFNRPFILGGLGQPNASDTFIRSDSIATALELSSWTREIYPNMQIHVCRRYDAHLAASRREARLERLCQMGGAVESGQGRQQRGKATSY